MTVLRFNSLGSEVMRLQQLLTQNGYTLTQDGHFGPATQEAVRLFQENNDLTPDGIVGYNTWKALGAVQVKQPEFLMIHCTATPEGSAGHNAEQTVHYHTQVLRWGRPGYSKIIEYDGLIVDAWPVDLSDGFQPFEITYGAAEWNPYAVHICYIGGMDSAYKYAKDTRTAEQKIALEYVVKDIIAQAPDIRVGGHNQFHNKACPSFSVPNWLRSIGISERNIYQEDPYGYVSRLS